MVFLWSFWCFVCWISWESSVSGFVLPTKNPRDPPAAHLAKTPASGGIVFNEKTLSEILDRLMDEDQKNFLDSQQDPWLNYSQKPGRSDDNSVDIRLNPNAGKWDAASEDDFRREFEHTLQQFNQLFQPLHKISQESMDDLFETESASILGNQYCGNKDPRLPHGSSQDCQPSSFHDRFLAPGEDKLN